jgi:hypothetical protein
MMMTNDVLSTVEPGKCNHPANYAKTLAAAAVVRT